MATIVQRLRKLRKRDGFGAVLATIEVDAKEFQYTADRIGNGSADGYGTGDEADRAKLLRDVYKLLAGKAMP